MSNPLSAKFTLNDLRAARASGRKVPILTCYDYTMARLMQQAGVPALLVGDSAGSVVLGHASTIPVSLPFMLELTARAIVDRTAPSISSAGIGERAQIAVGRFAGRKRIVGESIAEIGEGKFASIGDLARPSERVGHFLEQRGDLGGRFETAFGIDP